MKYRIILPLGSFLLFLIFGVSYQSWAQGKFAVSEFSLFNSKHTINKGDLEGYATLLIEDLDGDGLKDILFLKGKNIFIFPQSSLNGYPNYPTETLDLSRFSAVDTSDIGLKPGKELVLMGEDGIYCYTQNEGKFEANPIQIISEKTFYPPFSRKIEVWDFALDLNGDGEDEILLPKQDRLIIYSKDPKGFYKIKQEIPLESQISIEFGDTTSEYSVRTPSSVLNTFDLFKNKTLGQPGLSFVLHLTTDKFIFIDLNEDNRKDLVIIKQGSPKELSDKKRFFVAYCHYIFFQNEQGFFPQEPSKIFETHRSSWLSGFYSDINGDGKIDKLEISHLMDSPLSQRELSVIKVFLATGGNTYPAQPQQVIKAKGSIWENTPFLGLDKDGDLDLLVVATSIPAESVGSLVNSFLEEGRKFIFQFYLWKQGKGYPKMPNFTKAIKWSLFNNQFLSFDGDFNGDGYLDIALFRKDKVEIFTLINVKKGFSDRPWFTTPIDEFDSFYIDELNGDGRSDIILVNLSAGSVKVMLSQKD